MTPCFGDAESANQRNFCVIIVVETRDVLFVRTRDRLLRLHYLHGIGDTRAETIARLSQRLFRQVNVAARYIHLVRRGLQVQQRGAHVGIDLCSQIFQALPALFKSRIGLQNIPMNATALKDRNRQRSTHIGHRRRVEGCVPGP